MEQVTGNVYVETEFRGCNPGFVVTREGVVMIDSPQRPTDARKWRDVMKAKGEIRFLVNTEPHGDHVTGNFFFPATVVGHQGTRDACASLSLEMIMDRVKQIDPEGIPLMKGYFLKKPSITFSERMFLHVGDHTFELIHLPGHTASETAVHLPEERVVFTGDNVFHKVQAFLHQANPQDWLSSLKKIEELDVDRIIPGHGKVCDKRYLREQASFIEEWVETVREAIGQGLSREEAREKISFLDRYPMDTGLEDWGPEVQKWNVDNLYNLLKGNLSA